jgi:hypothetical protein
MGIRMMLAKAITAVFLCLAAAGLVVGCSGSDSEKAVQKTVEDLSGKTTVDQGNKLKKQIYDLSDQEVQKVQQQSEAAPGDEGGGQGKGN